MDRKLTLTDQKCFYQKFRYKTEKRSGKKTNDNFMFKMKVPFQRVEHQSLSCLKLSVFCVCADDCTIIHPNILVGKSNCKNGVYHLEKVQKQDIHIDAEGNPYLEIPYLYIVRTKNEEKFKTVMSTCKYVPENFQTMKDEDYYKNIKTDCVKLRAVLEVDGQCFSCVSNQINHHDGGENVSLNIVRLSCCAFPADEGGEVFIMTNDKHGPDIKPAEYEVYIETDRWTSEKYILVEQDISYKRVIIYKVPAYGGNVDGCHVNGKIVLRCITNNNTCSCEITYTPCYISRKRKALDDISEGKSKKPHHGHGKEIYEAMYSDDNTEHMSSENIMNSKYEDGDITASDVNSTSIVNLNKNQQIFFDDPNVNYEGRVAIPQQTESEDTSITGCTTTDDSNKKFYVNEAGGSFKSQPSIQVADSESSLIGSPFVDKYFNLDSMDQIKALSGITEFHDLK